MEGCRQISCQNLRSFSQTLRAAWIRTTGGLSLLHEVPDLLHFGLLIFVQLPSPDGVQTGLGMRKALIDGSAVLFLLIRRKDVTEFGRRRGGSRLSGRCWRGNHRAGCWGRCWTRRLLGGGRLRRFVHLIRARFLRVCGGCRTGSLGTWGHGRRRRRCWLVRRGGCWNWYRYLPLMAGRFPSQQQH